MLLGRVIHSFFSPSNVRGVRCWERSSLSLTRSLAGQLEVTPIKIRKYSCPANLPNYPFVPTAYYKPFARIILHGVMVTSEETPYV